MDHHMSTSHYLRFLLMIALSFVSMYALMYAMVDTLGNVQSSLNQLYMAGLMTAPMAILEVLFMDKMYQNKILNVSIIVVSFIALGGFFILIRQQTAITDEQFLRSMIPHHAGAILMCNEASLLDAEIKELCQNIVTGQQAEIDWMKAKLEVF